MSRTRDVVDAAAGFGIAGSIRQDGYVEPDQPAPDAPKTPASSTAPDGPQASGAQAAGTQAAGNQAAGNQAAGTQAAGDPAAQAPAAPRVVPAAQVPKVKQERSPKDMALSLLVLLIPIALLLAFYRLVLGGDDPITVDPAPAIAEARSAAAFEVLEPAGLGDDWAVSTATFRRTEGGAVLRIGYVDPDGDPIQLVQSNIASATLVPAELGSTGPGGTVKAGTRTWQGYQTRPGEQAIVLIDKGRTVIVVGKTELPQLQKLAAALG
jgi:hypothetical protein